MGADGLVMPFVEYVGSDGAATTAEDGAETELYTKALSLQKRPRATYSRSIYGLCSTKLSGLAFARNVGAIGEPSLEVAS